MSGGYNNYSSGQSGSNDGMINLIVALILLAVAAPIVAIYWIITGTQEKKAIGWVIIALFAIAFLFGGN